MVHHAGQAVLTGRPTRHVIGLVAAASALALVGCGGGSNPSKTAAGSGGTISASPVSARSANCQNWRNSTVAQRRAIVTDIRTFAGGPVGSPGGHGAVIPDATAYRIFESYCSHPFARAFKLYKLYTRAAAFSHVPVPGPQ